jgi:hypothetical protein
MGKQWWISLNTSILISFFSLILTLKLFKELFQCKVPPQPLSKSIGWIQTKDEVVKSVTGLFAKNRFYCIEFVDIISDIGKTEKLPCFYNFDEIYFVICCSSSFLVGLSEMQLKSGLLHFDESHKNLPSKKSKSITFEKGIARIVYYHMILIWKFIFNGIDPKVKICSHKNI